MITDTEPTDATPADLEPVANTPEICTTTLEGQPYIGLRINGGQWYLMTVSDAAWLGGGLRALANRALHGVTAQATPAEGRFKD